MSELITSSALDSRRFGVQVYRARVDDLETAARALAFRGEAPVELMIARAPVERLEVVQALEAGGFFLCDTLVYWAGSTAPFGAAPELERHEGPRIREAGLEDRAALEEVARASFTGFQGHYHADLRLDPAAATEGYVEWCLSALADPSSFVLVAQGEERLAGFVTVKRTSAALGEVMLNGVAPAFQRRGIYAKLFAAAGLRLRQEGRAEVSSSTQLSNWAPQRVWARHGLEPVEAFYTLHRWSTP